MSVVKKENNSKTIEPKKIEGSPADNDIAVRYSCSIVLPITNPRTIGVTGSLILLKK